MVVIVTASSGGSDGGSLIWCIGAVSSMNFLRVGGVSTSGSIAGGSPGIAISGAPIGGSSGTAFNFPFSELVRGFSPDAVVSGDSLRASKNAILLRNIGRGRWSFSRPPSLNLRSSSFCFRIRDRSADEPRAERRINISGSVTFEELVADSGSDVGGGIVADVVVTVDVVFAVGGLPCGSNVALRAPASSAWGIFCFFFSVSTSRSACACIPPRPVVAALGFRGIRPRNGFIMEEVLE